jgi:hypothetical protein
MSPQRKSADPLPALRPAAMSAHMEKSRRLGTRPRRWCAEPSQCASQANWLGSMVATTSDSENVRGSNSCELSLRSLPRGPHSGRRLHKSHVREPASFTAEQRNNSEAILRKQPEAILRQSPKRRSFREMELMSAFAQSFSQASGIQIGDLLKPVAKVCGAALAIWLLAATYGLDLSSGFF